MMQGAEELEAPLDLIEWNDGGIVVKEDPTRRIAAVDLVGRMDGEHALRKTGEFTSDTSHGAFGATFSAAVIDVAVDSATGKIRLLNSAAVIDAGRAINPAKVIGQIYGGELQGLGFGLTEDMPTTEGRNLAPTLMQYLIPTSMDAPERSAAGFVEQPSSHGPYGAKGVAAHAVKDAAPALAAAIHDAVGVWITDLPATPEKVWSEIEKRRAESPETGRG